MSATLYEIVDKMQRIFADIEYFDGEISPKMGEAIDELNLLFFQKVEAVALYIKHLEAEKKVITNEIERLYNSQKVKENKIEKMKEYLLRNMKEAKENKIVTPLIQVRWQISDRPLSIIDESVIPNEYKIGTITLPYSEIPENLLDNAKISIKKGDLKYALKIGMAIPGATLSNPTEFLVIK